MRVEVLGWRVEGSGQRPQSSRAYWRELSGRYRTGSLAGWDREGRPPRNPTSSHTIYSSISFRKLIAPHNRQFIVY